MSMTFKMPPTTHCALTYNYDAGGAASSELAAHPPPPIALPSHLRRKSSHGSSVPDFTHSINQIGKKAPILFGKSQQNQGDITG